MHFNVCVMELDGRPMNITLPLLDLLRWKMQMAGATAATEEGPLMY